MKIDKSTTVRQYTCSDCGKEVAIEIPAMVADFDISRCDDCILTLTAKEAKERADQWKREIVRRSGIPFKYLKFDKPYAERLGTMNLLNWISPRADQSILITGDNGTGKTHTVAYAAYRRMMRTLKPCMFIECPEWFSTLMQLKQGDKQDQRDAKELTKLAKTAGHLILDDIGKEKATEAKQELVWNIINYREVNDGLITWITTNESEKKIMAHLGNHGRGIITRLKRMVPAENVYNMEAV
jgi:DNA replication protein DnaC